MLSSPSPLHCNSCSNPTVLRSTLKSPTFASSSTKGTTQVSLTSCKTSRDNILALNYPVFGRLKLGFRASPRAAIPTLCAAVVSEHADVRQFEPDRVNKRV